MKGMIIVLSGPSGAGKGRISQELMSKRKNIKKVLSVTTREKREDDIGKENYIFVDENCFKYMKEHGMFFETTNYDDAWYGTMRIPEEELQIRDLIFEKDINGALAIKEAYPETITIYIMPKDNETLLKRRGNRGKHRSEIAMAEVEKAKQLEYLVINDDINNTVYQVEAIIEERRNNSTIERLEMNNKKNIEFIDNFYN